MDAEDLTSELFEILPHRIENHQINHFKSWLYTVVKNECFMVLRKKKIRTDDLTHDSLAMDETSLEEKYIGFAKLKGELSGKPGVKNPAALAASIGRKKYGKQKFQKAAAEDGGKYSSQIAALVF